MGIISVSGLRPTLRGNPSITELWALGKSPINIYKLGANLKKYPNKPDAQFLLSGFQTGFKLNYNGPRLSVRSHNLLSARQENQILNLKLYEDKYLGRIIGPFPYPPISNLRINPVGLVPKNTGGWRLITNLSFPSGSSVNDFIDPAVCHVQYSKFDNAVNILQHIGKSAFMAKADIKSAFNLCPIWPGDFGLLGIKTDAGYWVQKMLPMGASCSCYIFEKFATFIQWLVCETADSSNMDHLLDDFFMAGVSYFDCLHVVYTFESICKDLGIPLCEEKKVGPITSLVYLGLELDSVNQTIKVPREKIEKARSALLLITESKKMRLKQFQSAIGLLNFICKAIPAGRTFNRRFYDAMSRISKPHHYIRINAGICEDARVWLKFLEHFNGSLTFSALNWSEDSLLELFTDASGNKNLGCGCYFKGHWSVFPWPIDWDNNAFTDITYLELVPICLAFSIWGQVFKNDKIILRSDNEALVGILNKKSSKNHRVMHLLRFLILLTLENNIQIKAVHIRGKRNTICDSISRFQWQRLSTLLPEHASKHPTPVPQQFLQIFNQR